MSRIFCRVMAFALFIFGSFFSSLALSQAGGALSIGAEKASIGKNETVTVTVLLSGNTGNTVEEVTLELFWPQDALVLDGSTTAVMTSFLVDGSVRNNENQPVTFSLPTGTGDEAVLLSQDGMGYARFRYTMRSTSFALASVPQRIFSLRIRASDALPGGQDIAIGARLLKVVDSAGSSSAQYSNSTFSFFSTGTDQTSPEITIADVFSLRLSAGNSLPKSDSRIEGFLSSVNAFDRVDGVLTATNNAPDVFPLGATEVVFKVSDMAGNMAEATAEIILTTLDADSDDILDAWESQNGLDPSDATDGRIDFDGDGLTNLEEFANNSNPNRDDVPPAVSAPADYTMMSMGPLTPAREANPSAIDARDGIIQRVIPDNPGPYPSGKTEVIWTATDKSGNSASATQTINIVPRVNLYTPYLAVSEGVENAHFFVRLNGPAVEYPVTLQYSIDTARSTTTNPGTNVQNADHNLPVSGTLTISEPGVLVEDCRQPLMAGQPIRVASDGINSAFVCFDVVADDNNPPDTPDPSNPPEDAAVEKLYLTIASPSNAILGSYVEVGIDVLNGPSTADPERPLIEFTVLNQNEDDTSTEVFNQFQLIQGGQYALEARFDSLESRNFSCEWEFPEALANVSAQLPTFPVGLPPELAPQIPGDRPGLTPQIPNPISLPGLSDPHCASSDSETFQSSRVVLIAPAMETIGKYRIAFSMTQLDSDGRPTDHEFVEELFIEVVGGVPVIPNGLDSDGDGILDVNERFSDANRNFIPDNIDPASSSTSNILASGVNSTGKRLFVTSNQDSMLSLGSTAFFSSSYSADISLNDLVEFGSVDGESVMNSDPGNFFFSSGVVDFRVRLPQVGGLATVVIPLRIPIVATSTYRKYSESTAWTDFVVNENNLVYSAADLGEGVCPAPGSSSYSAGLAVGHTCVQLTIADGGPNDADGIANGIVVDPGGVASPPAATPQLEVDGQDIEDTYFIKGDSKQVVLKFSLDANSDTYTVQSFSFGTSGEINEVRDVKKLSLFRDFNADGIPQLSENIGEDVFSSDNGQLKVVLDSPIVLLPGTTQFLVTYDF